MPDNRFTARNDWFRVWMPYQFIKLDVVGPKHVYLPLNRNYKPLGYGPPRGGSVHVDYLDYKHQAVVFSENPQKIVSVWYNLDGLYLYSDNAESQKNYFDRLDRLMSRTVRLFGTQKG